MLRNLAKAPLLAVLFAAVFVFAGVFVPLSEGYAQTMAAFEAPQLGYVFLIAYGLWAAVLLALLFCNARLGGVRLSLISLGAMLGCMWITPFLESVWLGETTGVMTRADCLFRLAQGAVTTAILALLAFLLYRTPPKPNPPQPRAKIRIKISGLVPVVLGMPVVYFIVGFCSRYFLLLRIPAAREFHTGSVELRPFMGELVNLLLNSAISIPVALAEGFLFAAFLVLLLWPMIGKRLWFLVCGAMLLESCALLYLLPNPLMPDAVRVAHLIETSALNVFYGLLTAFLLSRCFLLEKPEVPVPVPAAAGKKASPGAAPKRRPAPAGTPAPAKLEKQA